jgi:molybdate transport system substrate-binding protein
MRHIALTALSFLMLSFTSASAAELHFFAGAGLRQPLDRLVDDFQKKAGHRVVLDYDGSGRLLARITASGLGDLFMPGSFFYVEKLQAQGKIYSWKPA